MNRTVMPLPHAHGAQSLLASTTEKTAGEWALAGLLYGCGMLFFTFVLFSFILAFLAWPFGELKYAVTGEPGVPQVRMLERKELHACKCKCSLPKNATWFCRAQSCRHWRAGRAPGVQACAAPQGASLRGARVCAACMCACACACVRHAKLIALNSCRAAGHPAACADRLGLGPAGILQTRGAPQHALEVLHDAALTNAH